MCRHTSPPGRNEVKRWAFWWSGHLQQGALRLRCAIETCHVTTLRVAEKIRWMISLRNLEHVKSATKLVAKKKRGGGGGIVPSNRSTPLLELRVRSLLFETRCCRQRCEKVCRQNYPLCNTKLSKRYQVTKQIESLCIPCYSILGWPVCPLWGGQA